MTLPLAALRLWADAIADPGMVRTGATRHRLVFSCTVDLDDFIDCTWADAGFTLHKLRYLRRRYPPADLPDDGCIVLMGHALTPEGGRYTSATRTNPHLIVYRRVDVTRGWLADVLYLRTLGWSGKCHFSCPQVEGGDGLPAATLHAVNASAVAPAVFAAGLWRGASPVIARSLRRAIVHRARHMHEGRAATRRINDWAHRISSVEDMLATIETIDHEISLTGEEPVRTMRP